jgi:phosphoglycerate kinase
MTNFKNNSFKNKRVIVRVDFNVPLNDVFEVTDDTRIRATIPTIKKILHDGGSVVLMSHLGRPKSGPEKKFSMIHTKSTLEKLLGISVQFSSDCIGEEAEKKAQHLQPGEVLLLENLRFYKEETEGDIRFSKKLAQLADVYVNDAFGTAHRAHASTTIIAQFFPNNCFFGMLMSDEIESLDKVIHQHEKPFTAIIGGAKVSSKINIIENLMNKADNIIIGGGMAYTFISALGGNIGNSLVEDDKKSLALDLIEKAKQKGIQLLLPIDTVVGDKFDNHAQTKTVDIYQIEGGWLGLDIGEKTIALYKKTILNSRTILWNGPMGVFEMSSFEKGTKEIALCVAEATSKGAYSLVGGGDSVAAINQFHLNDKVSYVSTGGGAMLEYLEGKELPGVKAIRG